MVGTPLAVTEEQDAHSREQLGLRERLGALVDEREDRGAGAVSAAGLRSHFSHLPSRVSR